MEKPNYISVSLLLIKFKSGKKTDHISVSLSKTKDMIQKGPITCKFRYNKINLDPVPISIIKFKNGKNGSQYLGMVKLILTLFH